MSMYADYLLEKTDKSIIETDSGFATYSFPDNSTVYIEDIFIIPSKRQSKAASHLADQIVSIAKERGCTKLLGSVQPSTKNSTLSLKVLLGYGMELDSSTQNFILFKKDL